MPSRKPGWFFDSLREIGKNKVSNVILLETTTAIVASGGAVSSSCLHQKTKNLEHENFSCIFNMHFLVCLQADLCQTVHIILEFPEIQHYKLSRSHCKQDF